MRRFLLVITTILGILSVQCQTINIEFSHFGGKGYDYLVVHGEKQDTVVSGKLDKSGKTTITFNGPFKGYKGMSRLLFDDGSGLDLIVNKENFTIRCIEAIPDAENIHFISSPENEYLLSQTIKQQKILRKAQIADAVLASYKSTDAVYVSFEKEQQQLEQNYKLVKNNNAQSTLYAARIIEVVEFLIGIGSSLKLSEEQKMAEANTFVLSKLDMNVLYNSYQWNTVLTSWLSLQQYLVKDDAILLENLQQVGARIKSNEQYTAFADLMVKQLAKIGKDDLISAFGIAIASSGRIEKPGRYLLAAMGGPQKGMLAPFLTWDGGNHTFNKNQKTILIFYESGCNNCDNEMNSLRGNYPILLQKGYEVVSVTSDMDKATSEKSISSLPWKKKYCDYKGTAGDNFISYGVIGTPTIFIIDKNGIITGRYASLAETHILN